jgi:hypothetical protein
MRHVPDCAQSWKGTMKGVDELSARLGFRSIALGAVPYRPGASAGLPFARTCKLEVNVGIILLVVLILLLIGAIPTWPHSRNWGYYPSGGLGLVLLIVIILLVMGRL